MSGEDHSWLKGGGQLDTESVRQQYDAWADDYDATLAQWNYRAPSEAAAMLKPLIPADAAILDFGAGTGLSGQAMRDAGFTGRLDGSDVSPRSVEIARERGVYSDVRVVDGNALPLPYQTDSYDAAISIGVLTYIADVEALLRELARATRSGGYLLVTHREDLAREQDFAGLAERLATEGVWTVERISDPQPYLPGNPDFADEIGVIYALLRVV
jgi:predicted TPR repeat methyltransferase